MLEGRPVENHHLTRPCLLFTHEVTEASVAGSGIQTVRRERQPGTPHVGDDAALELGNEVRTRPRVRVSLRWLSRSHLTAATLRPGSEGPAQRPCAPAGRLVRCLSTAPAQWAAARGAEAL